MTPQRNGQPSVTVIVPVYNGEQFLANAIGNIVAQDYAPLEIIVVDDGSTDGTARLAAAFGGTIRYVYQAQAGPAAARNSGIRLASGELIAFLDVDDEWAPNRLRRGVHFLAEHPEVEIVQGMIVQMQLDPAAPAGEMVFEECSEPYQYINVGSAIYRKRVFDEVGLFDESLPDSEDTDWFFRAWEHNITKVVQDQVALYYRLHPGNMTNAQASGNRMVRIFKRHLDRLRAAGPQSSKAPNLPKVGDYIGVPPEKKQVAHINDTKFTIISNDCWGSGPYSHLRQMYRTPTIGTRIFAPCYLELLRDPKLYLNAPLELISRSRYDFMNERAERLGPYPIGLLRGKVEVHFVHEADPVKAKAKWERRASKINWDNLYIKFSEDIELPNSARLDEFDRLDYPYKVCFTKTERPELRSAIAIPGYYVEEAPMYFLSRHYFNTIDWLNKLYGPDTRAYRVQSPAQ